MGKKQQQRKIPTATNHKNQTYNVCVSRDCKIYNGVTSIECYVDNDKAKGLYDIVPDVMVVTNAAIIIQYNVVTLPGVFFLSVFNADPLNRSLKLDKGMIIAKAVVRS
jgi:hypothetical protein